MATTAKPLVCTLDFGFFAITVRLVHKDLDAIFVFLFLWVCFFGPFVDPGRLLDVNAHSSSVLPIADKAAGVRARAEVAALALR